MKNEIFDLYKKLQLGNCETCHECRKANLANAPEFYDPVSIYTIGENFKNSDDTILFVGKTARGGDDNALGSYIDETHTITTAIDATKFGEDALDGKGYTSAYYTYTNEIIKEYFGSYEEGRKNIALTNLVKCNNGTQPDTSIGATKLNCIENLRDILSEVEILIPTRIIFYSNTGYDYFIDKFLPSFASTTLNITEKDHKIEVGEKHPLWWHRDFFDANGKKNMSFLRLSHPERLSKADYVNNVVEWLQRTKI
jgi:hypothetical protein